MDRNGIERMNRNLQNLLIILNLMLIILSPKLVIRNVIMIILTPEKSGIVMCYIADNKGNKWGEIGKFWNLYNYLIINYIL